MKKLFLSMMLVMAAFMSANAMSFERAQAEALYLTDKMAYELNLNDQQYNDAYEINLDYFLRVDSPSDIYGSYYDYRLYDLRCILHDWQYSLLTAADYFLRPIIWRAGGWHFPIYSYYNRSYYYYSRPSVWVSYRGGHSRYYHHAGFYADRRPHWNGGLRGHDMHRPSVGSHHPSSGRSIRGNGYHIDFDRHHGGNVGHSAGNNHGGMNSGGREGHRGDMNHGGGSNEHSGRGYGNSHSSSSSYSGSGHSSYGGAGRGASRGNSFDGSSSRMGSGSHMGGASRGGASFGGSRGGSSMSGSRSSSPSMSGSSRGGGMNHSAGMSRGGGGVSRSGRR